MMSEENKLWDWSSFNTSIAVTMLMSVIVSLILYIRYTVLAEIKYNEAAKYFKDIENLYDAINNNQQVDKRITCPNAICYLVNVRLEVIRKISFYFFSCSIISINDYSDPVV